jgi:hypothetical protein
VSTHGPRRGVTELARPARACHRGDLHRVRRELVPDGAIVAHPSGGKAITSGVITAPPPSTACLPRCHSAVQRRMSPPGERDIDTRSSARPETHWLRQSIAIRSAVGAERVSVWLRATGVGLARSRCGGASGRTARCHRRAGSQPVPHPAGGRRRNAPVAHDEQSHSTGDCSEAGSEEHPRRQGKLGEAQSPPAARSEGQKAHTQPQNHCGPPRRGPRVTHEAGCARLLQLLEQPDRRYQRCTDHCAPGDLQGESSICRGGLGHPRPQQCQ